MTGVREVARRASPPWLSRGERAASFTMAGVAAAILLIAARLEPSAQGMGTHQQLGLPACSWPIAIQIPCPSCGMTTAFAHAARGDLLSSFITQPFGALLALATAVAVVAGTYAAVTGTRVLTFFAPLGSKFGAAIAVGALLAAWIYKIAEFRSSIG